MKEGVRREVGHPPTSASEASKNIPWRLSCFLNMEARIDTRVEVGVPLGRYEGYVGLKRLQVEVGEVRRTEGE